MQNELILNITNPAKNNNNKNSTWSQYGKYNKNINSILSAGYGGRFAPTEITTQT